MILRLNCDFAIFPILPAYYTLQPNYSLSSLHPDTMSIEGKFKTTPLYLIPFKKIIKDVFKVNGVHRPKKYKIVNPQLYIEIYDQNIKANNLILHPQLDGSEYVYVTGVPKDGFWRTSMNFLFDVVDKKKKYSIQVVDDRDYSNIETIYSAGNVVYPDIRFIVIGANEVITTENAIEPTPA